MNRTRLDLGTGRADQTKWLPQTKGPSMRGVAAVFLCMSVAGLLGSCGATRPSKYYQLTVPGDVRIAAQTADSEPAGQAGDPAPVTLLVGNLLASHLYREDRIVYGAAGQQMGTYEYHRWTEPPTEMVQDILVRELRASGRYRSVYAQRSSTNGDFLLRGRIYDFKEVSGSPMTARVTVEFELRDLKTGATVWTHYYQHDEPVNGKDVPAVVAALDKNVQHGVKEVSESLNQYFRSHPVK